MADDLFSSMGRAITDWIAGRSLEPGISPHDTQNEFNGRRDDVRKRAADIGFDGEYRPGSVVRWDNFERSDLATLRANVDKIDLDAVDELIAAWREVGRRETSSLGAFNAAMAKALDSAIWRGVARDAAAAALYQYSVRTAQFAHAVELTGNKLEELKTGLEPTKALVPYVPEQRSTVRNVRSWLAGRGWRDNEEAYNTAKTEAVRVLNTVYARVIRDTDTKVPIIPKAYNPVRESPGANGELSPRTDRESAGREPGTGQFETRPEPKSGTGQSETTPEPKSGTAQSNQEPRGESGSGVESPGIADEQPKRAKPPDTGDQVAPATTTPAGLAEQPRPGSNIPGAGPHSFDPTTHRTPSDPQRPFATLRPPPLARPEQIPAAGRAPASAQQPSGMPGMAPGAVGKRDDQERGRGVPDYLITKEHGEQVTGLDALPKAVPPVLGE
ncbi:hypothetical protein D5S18_04680 [Nocardia panacis]|uniref:PPE domain-containing protein n=1 Tax=Nocardia panacis TaxID=2340916 RepID=A0A3A4KUP6_9NOCA|nr:hypothetical protein [Nocardia panacis]RJO78821.1 hypothetical protein D5S18_04680 [Nocardia panacis]